MKNKYSKKWLVTLLLFSLSTLLLANDSTLTKIEELNVNGLKVIFKPVTVNEVISVQLYIKGGVLNIDEKTQGMEQLIFSSLTLTDRKYADSTWSKLFSGVGAEIGSYSSKEFTIVSLRCYRNYFEKLWGAYTDYIMNSGFYDERVDITKQKLVTALKSGPDHPDGYIRGLAESQFYEGHRYGLSSFGTEETIPKIRMKDMDNYLEELLEKKRMVLVVVGNLDKKALKRKVKDTLADLPKGKYRPKFPEMVTHDSSRVKVVERDLPTNYMIGLFTAPPMKHPDYYPTVVATNILKWRLFEEVRTKRNLSYAPDAFVGNYQINYGGVYATSVKPDTTAKVIIEELKKLREELVTPKDLHDRVNMYLTQYYLNNESNSAQGQFLAFYELSGLGWREAQNMIAEIKKVTPEDIKRVAQKYFKNLQFVYLGDPELIDKSVFTSL